MAKRKPIEAITVDEIFNSSVAEEVGDLFANRLLTFTGSPDKGAPVTGAPDTGASDADYVVSRVRRPVAWIKTQDAHTHGEQAVYATMFRLAKPFSPGAKKLIIGVRTLADEVPMTYNNTLANVRSLQAKLAIEDKGLSGHRNDGRVYLVYDYETVNERRRSAGLTHVLRTARRVDLLAAGAPVTGAPVSFAGAPITGYAGAPVTGALINKELPEQEASSSEVTDVCGRMGVLIDDDAARRIIAGCRAADPAATVAEIAVMTQRKIEQFKGREGIQNMPGLLIAAVPEYFKQPQTLVKRLRKEWASQS